MSRLLCLAALLTGAARAAKPPADLILYHGRVFVAPGRYAQALAVGGGRILAVGADAEILALAPVTPTTPTQ